MDNKCSIIIQSCDSYEDVWMPFFLSFFQYWRNCPYKLFLNTENKSFKFENLNIEVLNCIDDVSKIYWGKRLLDCLNRLDTEYVISVFDDFLLNNFVEQSRIESVIKMMDENPNINVVYLINSFPDLEKKSDFVEVPIGKDFRLNSSPAIWRRKSLIEYTGKTDNPWAWEYFGTMRTEKKGTLFYSLGTVTDIFPYDYSLGGAIHGGKWVKSVISPIAEKYDLKIDFSIRGFEDENKKNYNHSLLWNIKFFSDGFRMVGFKAFRFWWRLFVTIVKCGLRKLQFLIVN